MKNKHLLLFIICSLVIAAVFFAFFGSRSYSPDVYEQSYPLINNDLERTNPGGLHLVSWNTGYFSKGSDFSLEKPDFKIKTVKLENMRVVYEFIDSQPADLLLLQEITSGNARLLAGSLQKYNIYYSNGFKKSAISSILKGKQENGMAVLSAMPVDESYRHYPEFEKDKNEYKYFFQTMSLKSSEEGKNWFVINCGTNEYPEADTRKAIIDYIPEYLNTLDKDNYYIIFAGDFSAFSLDEIDRITNSLPAGWKVDSASNKPDGRDPAAPYKRLESRTWNKVLFLSYSNVILKNILSHDLKFRDTPGNPVSAIFSIAE